jgi:hypothetical protein
VAVIGAPLGTLVARLLLQIGMERELWLPSRLLFPLSFTAITIGQLLAAALAAATIYGAVHGVITGLAMTAYLRPPAHT